MSGSPRGAEGGTAGTGGTGGTGTGGGPEAERHVWAVRTMDVRPDDRVLEIGCGHGVAVSLVAERLTGTGRITAIDRSAKMAAAARTRNRAHVDAGRAVIVQTAMNDADFERGAFDKVFAAHVGVFWRGPFSDAARVADWLAPHGRLYLFGQPLDAGQARSVGDSVARGVERAGFAVREVLIGDTAPRPTVCVIAQAATVTPPATATEGRGRRPGVSPPRTA
ncbi:class I SAM-dependent methyltransferase [Streptomyces armeniacus]|uniref:Class I SAM-dependent methyltransferase n=1 Tax=Streptomyces armeniacus TaxID=83291 RepID=A0A345XI04_9ACTN|nr:class I SAM-dependent methyltransferase [Streptomyces armeniacus]AXK31270.1 class I SAM-dependent methyltransferase [Streptomyces armeniacus]